MSLIVKVVVVVAFVTSALSMPSKHLRAYDRRTDLADIPTVNVRNWTLSLQGGLTCTSNKECHDSLAAPPSDQSVKAVTIGRGVYNYTCENEAPANAPIPVSQYTELYDATPVIEGTQDEEVFHEVVHKLLDFDYGSIHNSTLECIGSIGTINNTAVISLYNIATFQASILETVNAPYDPESNGIWGHSVSVDRSWNVYRVETSGGVIPHTCDDRTGPFEIEYAAEYWFYHV